MLEESVKMNFSVSGKNASEIVFSVNSLDCFVYIEKNGRCVNAKSILGLLSLNLQTGDEVKILVNGNNEEDEKADMPKVLKLFN